MIFDIRGTNGAGKSHIPHTLIERFGPASVVPWDNAPAGTNISATFLTVQPGPWDLAMVGKYTTQCGGADGITGQDNIQQLMREVHAAGHNVIVEGSIVGSVFQRWSDLAGQYPGCPSGYVFLFLDTPLELCIERVLARRKAAGNDKPFDPDKTLIPRHRAILNVRSKLEAVGRTCVTLDHTRSVDQFLELFHASLAK